ncbi:ribonuclease R [Candidatus Wolfebacteria bacterium]|nr:ribonuclease R [Candidatus Wolfebacteria bacterium]
MAQRRRPKQKQRKKILRFEGVITTTRGGLGFIQHPDFEEDVRVEQEHLNTALNGDTVEAALLPRHRDGEPRGEVIRVVRRAKTRFVGIAEQEKNIWYLIPDDSKMYTDILIENPDGLSPNQKIVVELVRWEDPAKSPVGKVVQILGAKGEHEVEIASIVIAYNIDTRFPSSVDSEAGRIAKAGKDELADLPPSLSPTNEPVFIETRAGKRRDFRGIPTCTIDPDDAKDFDDALSLREIRSTKSGARNETLWEVGVHIADVSHYVKTRSALDEEAEKRGFSVYLVDRTIPMLPEELSNDLCSLNPGVPRFTFSATFLIDKEGVVKERWFGKGIINSDRRFAYEEAQKVLDAQRGEFARELAVFNTLAENIRTRRFAKGAIDFEQDEVEVEIDAKGTPVRIYRKERLATHKLIEEWMLLANREVAETIYRTHSKQNLNKGFIYRVHDLPDQEKLAEIAALVRGLGFSFPARSPHKAGGGERKKNISSKDINALFAQIEGTPIEHLIKTAAIRAMAKAAYATKNIGHFGLGFPHYTHFTSPIRRYPDLLVHRLLLQHLHGAEVPASELAYYESVAEELSEKEIEVQKAERESIKYKQVEYMAARVGDIFEGIITGVTEWGIYVEELTSGAEGLVRMRDLANDFYAFDQKHYRIRGEKTKKTYTLGDRVKFRVAGANVDRKTLDYLLV